MFPRIRESRTVEGKILTSTDDHAAVIAFAVKMEPFSYTLKNVPTFDEALEKLGVSKLIIQEYQSSPNYMTNYKILSDKLLNGLIIRTAELQIRKRPGSYCVCGADRFETNDYISPYVD